CAAVAPSIGPPSIGATRASAAEAAAPNRIRLSMSLSPFFMALRASCSIPARPAWILSRSAIAWEGSPAGQRHERDAEDGLARHRAVRRLAQDHQALLAPR